jgi:hypothetical protein
MTASEWLAPSAKAVAVFDVGSASIGVGIAVRTDEGLRLPWSSRLSFGYEKDIDYERFVKAMLTNLLEAGMKLTSEGIPAAQKTHAFNPHDLAPVCVLAPPWFIGVVEDVKESSPTGLTVTPALLETLAATAEDKFVNNTRSVKWREVMGEQAELIETQLMRVRLDGYSVNHYENRQASEIVTTHFGAFTPVHVAEEVRSVLQKVIPNHNPVFATSAHVTYRGVVKQGLGSGRLLLIELGEEITSVSLIVNNILTDLRIYPQGTNHLLRKGYPSAKSQVEAMGNITVLNESVKKNEEPKLPKGFSEGVEQWKKGLRETITDLVGGVTPPRNVVVVGPHAWKHWFTSAITEEWTQPGARTDIAFCVVEQGAAAEFIESKPHTVDSRLASLLRGIIDS